MEDPEFIAKQVDADGKKLVDSDEEEEDREKKDSEYTLKFGFDAAKLASVMPDGGSLVICAEGAVQALFKIIMDPDMSEVGKIEVTLKKEDKTETVATLWQGKGVAMFFMTSNVKSNYCSEIVEKLFAAATQKNCNVICLSTIYKNSYQTPDGLMQIDESKPLPFKFIKSSHKNDKIEAMISGNAAQFSPDNAFNFTGGLTAALLMEAEMAGRPAISLKCIVDQHVITTETL